MSEDSRTWLGQRANASFFEQETRSEHQVPSGPLTSPAGIPGSQSGHDAGSSAVPHEIFVRQCDWMKAKATFCALQSCALPSPLPNTAELSDLNQCIWLDFSSLPKRIRKAQMAWMFNRMRNTANINPGPLSALFFRIRSQLAEIWWILPAKSFGELDFRYFETQLAQSSSLGQATTWPPSSSPKGSPTPTCCDRFAGAEPTQSIHQTRDWSPVSTAIATTSGAKAHSIFHLTKPSGNAPFYWLRQWLLVTLFEFLPEGQREPALQLEKPLASPTMETKPAPARHCRFCHLDSEHLWQWNFDFVKNGQFYRGTMEILRVPCHLETVGDALERRTLRQTNQDLTIRLLLTPSMCQAIWLGQSDLFPAALLTALAKVYRRAMVSALKTSDDQHQIRRMVQARAESGRKAFAQEPPRLAFDLDARFRSVVERNPDQVVVYHRAATITYWNLDRRVEAMARWLAHRGLRSEEPVLVLLDPQPDLVAAFMAITRAGGTILAVDTQFPAKRVATLLEDCAPRFCITAGNIPKALHYQAFEILDTREPIPNLPFFAFTGPIHPDQLAYLMFTSGSTGKPKAVMGTHRGLTNRLSFFWRQWPMTLEDMACFKKPVSLIGAIPEVFSPVLSGVPIHIADVGNSVDPSELLSYLETRRITRMWGSPSLLQALVDCMHEDGAHLPHLKIAVSSGEGLTEYVAKRWLAKVPGARLFNVYGATELASDVSVCEVRKDRLDTAAIGRPLPNNTFTVVDDNGKIAPRESQGRLWVGGQHLARGYWRNPTATALAFRPDPFSQIPGERIFDSGDLVVMTGFGNTRFIGRADHQLNIRGFRIEPAEIESAIVSQPGVRQVAVSLCGQGALAKLIAHVIAQPERQPDFNEIRRHLIDTLPSYMVPNQFQEVERLPKTRSGKLDRQALKRLKPTHWESPTPFKPPSNRLERSLSKIWADVLGIEKVGTRHSFIELGGHSLHAIKILSHIRKRMGHRLPMAFIYQNRTIAAQAEVIRALQPSVMAVANDEAGYESEWIPLTPEQHSIWLQHQLAPESNHLHIHQAWLISNVEPAMVIRAVAALQNRHASLRMIFRTMDEVPHFKTLSWATPSLRIVDHRHRQPSTATLRAWQTSASRRPFDLGSPPFRCDLWLLPNRNILLSCGLHHLIADGWSLQILGAELEALVGGLTSDTGLSTPETTFSFYAKWRNKPRPFSQIEALRSFWLRNLKNLPNLQIYPDFPPSNSPNFEGREIRFTIPTTLRQQLQAWPKQYGSSLHVLGLSIFALLLGKRSCQRDFAILTPFANRGGSQSESTCGMFVQTLILRMAINPEDNLLAWVERVDRLFADASSHHGLAFEDLLHASNLQGKANGHQALRVMFDFHRDHPPGQAAANGLIGWRPRHPKYDTSQFDLTLNFIDRAGGMEIRLQYKTAAFGAKSIFRLGRQFLELLKSGVNFPEWPIARLNCLPPEEWRRWFSPLAVEPTGFTPIHHRVLLAASRWPDRTAIIFGQKSLTYGALTNQASRLGNAILQAGMKPGDYLAIFADAGPKFASAMLACMATGVVGLSVSPDQPAESVKALGRKPIVRYALWATDRPLPMHFPIPLLPQPKPGPALGRLGFEEFPSNWPIFAMFTSGTTGEPKMVEVTHEGIANRFDWMDRTFPTNPKPAVLQTTAPQFDSHFWEVFWPLTHGGKTVLSNPPENLEGAWIAKQIQHHRITILDSVPSIFRELLDGLSTQEPRSFESLGILILGSENFPLSLARKIAGALPHCQLWNLYGPTEASIGCVGHQLDGKEPAQIPIGTAISGTHALVLDRLGKPTPCGMPGELFLAGKCLANGYFGMARATAAAFLPHPSSTRKGDRLYKTGDLVRRLPSGDLVFCGRIDDQIKHHGIRIEPGEIEASLNRHPGLEACAVTSTQMERQARITAFFVAKTGHDLGAKELTSFLEPFLPRSLIPTHFVAIDQLPRNAAGKLDRKALTARTQAVSAPQRFALPRNRFEAQLIEIFQEVLNQKPVGTFDSFFALGGHSLSAIRLLARIRSRMGLDPPLRLLFEKTTPAALADSLVEVSAKNLPALRRLEKGNRLPLSYSQLRLWFLIQLEPQASHCFHIRLVKSLGPACPLHLEKAMNAIVVRHQLWRCCIRNDRGQPYFQLIQNHRIDLPIIDLSGIPPSRLPDLTAQLVDRETSKPFGLDGCLLHRYLLLRFGQNDHRLIFTCHHLIGDGWSMALWEREIEAHFRASLGLTKNPLKALSHQFADLAQWQRERFEQGPVDGDLVYWQQRLEGLEPLRLIAQGVTQKAPKGTAHEVSIHLSKPIHELVLRQAETNGVTGFVWMLTALKVLVNRYTGQPRICIGTPVAGRDLPESEALLGCFLNTMPLATNLGGNPSFAEAIARVRETFLGGLAHQDTPFEKLVDKFAATRDLDHSPFFQILMVWEHNLSKEEPGLFTQPQGPWCELKPLTKYDLTCEARQVNGGFEIGFRFDASRYPRSLAIDFAREFQNLVQRALENPHLPIQYLPLASGQPSRIAPHPEAGIHSDPKLLPSHFESMVRSQPDAIAITSPDGCISYGRLDDLANRLASLLVAHHLAPESVIAFSFARSPLSVVAMLAILRAGHAFLAIDPALPPQRRQYALKDGRARLLILGPDTAAMNFNAETPLLHLDLALLEKAPANAKLPSLLSQQMAYLVYTSGSTGAPKGIAIAHETIADYLIETNARYRIQPGDRILQMASLSFDACMRDVFGTLIAGATLVLPREDEFGNPGPICRRLRNQAISVIYSGVPSYLTLLAKEAAHCEEAYPSLRLVISGGERLFWRDVALLEKAFGGHVEVFNQYGLSETTVTVTSYRADREETAFADLPLGRPLAYAGLYLLSQALGEVPKNSVGWIYIAGATHARGYWQKPGLTARMFIPDPLSQEPGARMFHSGDLAWLSGDQALRYLGRADHQVKIRGQRVELGEIEACLKRHHAVAACAVRWWEAPNEKLVAYLKLIQTHPIDPRLLRKYLESRLPAVMVPQQFVILESLPRHKNNKIAYHLLPPPTASNPRPVSAQGFENQPTLSLLSQIWKSLLKVDKAGPEDHFFHLGGHSLIAAQVVARVRHWFGLELPLKLVFQKQTLGELAEAIDTLRLGPAPPETPPLVTSSETPLLLSSSQKRLWFLEQLEPGLSRFNMPVAYRVIGVRPLCLMRAIREQTQSHPALRTAIVLDKGEPFAELLPNHQFEPDVIDLTALSTGILQKTQKHLTALEARTLFHLPSGPLSRSRILILNSQSCLLLQTFHHLVGDAWSLRILERDLHLRLKRPDQVPKAPPLTYFDWTHWQARCLQGGHLQKLIAFWTAQMEDIEPLVLSVHKDLSRPSRGRGCRFGFNIPPHIVRRIRGLTENHGCTIFMALQAAFQTLLYRYSGQSRFCIGIPVANRSHLETENLVGLFMNTIPLRAQVHGDPSFETLLNRIRLHSLDAFSHASMPFEKLVQALDLPRQSTRTPLFQFTMVFQPDDLIADLSPSQGVKITRLRHRPTTAKYDLSAHFRHQGEALRADFVFDMDRFSETHIRRISQHFLRVLHWFTSRPTTRLSQLPLFSPSELGKLKALNTIKTPLPQPNLAEQFHRIATATPDATALFHAGGAWSFSHLSLAVTAHVDLFKRHGVEAGDRIVNGWPRSPQMIAAMLATFHIGAIHVPLDSDWPESRLRQILAETRPKIILAPPNWPQPRGLAAPTIAPSAVTFSATGPGLTPPPWPGEMPAYLLFTSGTSGQPKGVLGTHGAMMNRLAGLWQSHPYGQDETELAKKSPVFIGSFTEILGPLLQGRAVALMSPSEDRDPLSILRLAQAYRVSRLWAFPSLLRILMPALTPSGADLRHLKWLFSSGEPLTPETVRSLQETLPGVRIVNIYGSTELASDVAWQEVIHGLGSAIPIGRAMVRNQFWIRDRHGALQPFSLPGELLVGGLNLAQCYWQRPALTAWRFRPDSLSGQAGRRLFHTGDLANMNEAGQVTLLGRCDGQLKIRGYRIEPEEIQYALQNLDGIEDSAVAAIGFGDGPPELVAYIQSAKPLNPAKIRRHLIPRIQPYAIPTHFLFIEKIPRTQHGKLLTSALPKPGEANFKRSHIYERPRNHVEAILADIWSTVLGVRKVGIHDNFFELGGHSLLATQVRARINQQLNCELPLSSFFQWQTIADLAAQLRSNDTPALPAIVHRSQPGPLTLSHAQRRWWLLEQLEPGPHLQLFRAYRIPGLRIDWLETALARVAARHQPLRTLFTERHGRPRAKIHGANASFLNVIDLEGIPHRQTLARQLLAEERERGFDLATHPGFRALAITGGGDFTLLAFHFHHITIDEWGLARFRVELAAVYQALATARKPKLPELDVNYSDFAKWQRGWLRGAIEKRLLSFWKTKLSDAPNLVLNASKLDPNLEGPRGGSTPIRLSKKLTSDLIQLGRTHHATLFMVLLAAYRALLQRWSGQNDFCIGTPVANRQQPELEPLIGPFVNTLAIRVHTSKNPTFLELLACVRQETIRAFDHQDMPFERLVEALGGPRDPNRHPLFQTMFVHFNHPDPSRGQRAAVERLFGQPLTRAANANLFDLTLYLGLDRGAASGRLTFDKRCLLPDSAAALCRQFKRLLRQVSAKPDLRLSEIQLFDRPTLQKLARLWGEERWPRGQGTILDRMDRQTSIGPDRIAVVSGKNHLSRAFLDRQATHLAAKLQQHGVGPEVGVAICMRRSALRVIAQLGILKAGGAFIPIHPDHPQARIRQCLQLAKPLLVLGDEDLEPTISDCPTGFMKVAEAIAMGKSCTFTKPVIQPQNAAYSIFTSGTSGKPKLTVNHHAGIDHRIRRNATVVTSHLDDVVVHKTPFEFDVSVWELFWPLCDGLKLEIAGPAAFPQPHDLLDLLQTRRVSWVHFVPSTVTAMLDLWVPGKTETLRGIFCSGEALTPSLCREIHQRTGLPVHNLYGPTEAAVEVSCHSLNPGESVVPTLGRPLSGNRCYITDTNLAAVQPGQLGEICLGGCQVARGYSHQPGLTAERFVPDPFSRKPGSRLYRTGDLGHFAEDGNLHFHGRRDQQIKLRGVRLELGAIENELRGHPLVRDALVMASGAGENTTLTAYVILKPGSKAGCETTIRSHLANLLPAYAVPNQIVTMQRWPKTASGKIDRNALPSPLAKPEAEFKPQTHTQTFLAEVWHKLLRHRRFDLDDDFFKVGGNSLQLVRMATQISQKLGANLPLARLFHSSTIRQQAAILDHRALETSPIQVFRTVPRPGTWLLVHGGLGFSRPYRHLMPLLDPNGSVAGVQLTGSDLPASLAEMARPLVQALRNAPCRAPYHLIGWSLGGMLAFELARQLIECGIATASLTLIDVRRYDLLDHGAQQDLLAQIPATYGDFIDSDPVRKGSAGTGDQGDESGAAQSALANSGESKALQHHFRTLNALATACFSYRPQPIAIPLGLVHAQGKRRYNAWAPLGLGPVKEYQCQGNHFELLQSPCSEEIAKTLGLGKVFGEPEPNKP